MVAGGHWLDGRIDWLRAREEEKCRCRRVRVTKLVLDVDFVPSLDDGNSEEVEFGMPIGEGLLRKNGPDEEVHHVRAKRIRVP
ncbi:unnamed protein product [Toxocara canis]|uniref:Uncharacterized protein n=1 Tax=Toxocara canis TaxID=6265 RepID=A0A183V541_TOXCA|nr:unnamed protein product [Toxocara canis]